MKCRLANKDDLPILKELWYECFLEHDSKESIDYYFDNLFVVETTFILEVANEIVTSLQLNQHQLYYDGKVEDVSFVVGVATFKKHRKKGYMRILLEYAIDYARTEYNQKYMILQAYDWNVYRPFGFIEAYYKSKQVLDIEQLSKYKTCELTREINVAELLNIYNNYVSDLNGYKIRDEAYYTQLLKTMAVDDIAVAANSKAYIAYEIKDNTLTINECTYLNYEELLSLIKTVALNYNIEDIELYSDLKHVKGSFEKELYMMVKNLKNDIFNINDDSLYISETI